MPDGFARRDDRHFDQGTQRAILRLYRVSPPSALAAARPRARERSAARRYVVWGERDPYISSRFAEAYTAALGGPAEQVSCPARATGRGSTRPELVERIGTFLDGGDAQAASA